MIDPAVGALLAAAFALLFAGAALHKFMDLGHFAGVFRAYRIVPPLLAPLAVLVPLLELCVAAGLLLRGARPLACAGGALLLAIYAAAIAINLARGRRELTCGCGGPNDRRPIATWMVARNLLLAVLLAALLAPWGARPLGAADALTVGAGTLIAALLYMSIDALLARVAPRGAVLRSAG
jgi:hypothetical protein